MKKSIALLFVIATLLPALPLLAQDSSSESVRIPSRWFQRLRGYHEALEMQKQTGADLFLYISHTSPAGAKGLCSWWEKRGLKTGPVERVLRDYLKVEIMLPAERETRELAEQFRLWQGPTIVIIHPNGNRRSINVFDWPDGKPSLKEPEAIAQLILQSSSPRSSEAR
jgi:hypothetical protein